MKNKFRLSLFIGSITLLLLSACSVNTSDWEIFSIGEEPGFDIQFRMPPGWFIEYAPNVDIPGQWDLVVVPPMCSADQTTEFGDSCIRLTAYIKGTADFDQDEVLAYISQAIPLNQAGTEETLLMGQSTFEVAGLTFQRYNHMIPAPLSEVQMSIYYLETERAHYVFITDFPYAEREGDTAEQFDLLLQSIKVIE